MNLPLKQNYKDLSLFLKKGEKAIISDFDNWIKKSKLKKQSRIDKYLRARSNLIDRIIRDNWKKLDLLKESDIAVFAVGGFGRGELHPFSDIDLLILSTFDLTKDQEKKIETFLGSMWDLGLEIGHSVRNAKENVIQAKKDVRNMTNILESRFVTGDPQVKNILENLISNKRIVPNAVNVVIDSKYFAWLIHA